MRFTPFTLVHQPLFDAAEEQFLRGELDALRALSPQMVVELEALLRPGFRQTLIHSSFALATDGMNPAEVALSALSKVTTELRRSTEVETVGLWDLNARVGELPRLIEAFNAATPALAFFEVQAAVQAGLVSRAERVVAWAEEQLGRKLVASQREDIVSNVIDEDFFVRARKVRTELGVDYLVGLTASKVAYAEDTEIRWNYFSSLSGRLVLSSTFELRKFAARAKRPYEVAVGVVVLGQLLVAMNRKLRFHEDRGCLFDSCFKRKNLVDVIAAPALDEQCLARIAPKYREAAQALVAALRSFPGGQG